MKVGVRDIAREAGVAVSTVSHVLNGTASISREVRERVLLVARTLGYLDQRRAKATIATMEVVVVAVTRGFLDATETDPSLFAIYNGLRRECERRSLKMIASVSDDVGIDLAAVAESFRAENANGIILLGDGGVIDLANLALVESPLVLINGEEVMRRADTVVAANAFAARVAVRQLSDLGHSRFLLLTAVGGVSLAQRRTGFLEAIAEYRLAAVEPIVSALDDEAHAEDEVAARLAASNGFDGATALFCTTDSLAVGAIRALNRAGYRVPADVSVIGCGGAAAMAISPPLTTVSVHYQNMGISALSVMESRLMVPKPRNSCIHVELGAEFIAGLTIAPPPEIRASSTPPKRRAKAKGQFGTTGRGGKHARPISDRPR